MELPDLGSQCSFLECRQLDFLPMECLYCKLLFCKLHSVAEQHKCKAQIESYSEKPSQLSVDKESFQCTLQGCKRSELAPVICSDCKNQYCVGHRLPQDHQCSMLVVKKHDTRTPTEKVESIIGRKLEGKNRTTVSTSRKSAATNAKVQQMKLKMKAKGNKSIPSEEKIYFNVIVETKSLLPMYFSCQHSVGKMIDQIAIEFGLKNENHLVGTDTRLKLFNKDDELLPADRKLMNVLQSTPVMLENFDTIYLRKC